MNDAALRTISHVLNDIESDGQIGAAAVLREVGTEDFIQFALVSDERIQFDVPIRSESSPNFDANGPWETVSELPKVAGGQLKTQLSTSRLSALTRTLDDHSLEWWYHFDAVFDDQRRPLATAVTLQLEASLSDSRLPKLISDIFCAVHSYDPHTIEFQRFTIEWN